MIEENSQADTSSSNNQMIDYRIEYTSLMAAYSAVSSMYWTGYAAFFAVNTLLATGTGLTYSLQAGVMPKLLIQITQIFISVTGIMIGFISIYAAYLITKHQNIIVKRGTEIESVLYTRSFSVLAPTRNSFPWLTTIGSVPFIVIWTIVLLAALKII